MPSFIHSAAHSELTSPFSLADSFSSNLRHRSTRAGVSAASSTTPSLDTSRFLRVPHRGHHHRVRVLSL